jgi:hypothetical protein
VTALRAGEVFAGYRVEGVLGQGGMGAVYLAQHPRLPRLTALKLLNAELFGDHEYRLRFEREADFVARLEHPNIVAVYDRGLEGRFLWISMQYVAGTDAAAIGIVDLRRAARIVSETATALDYAHRHGVLHRDVKPANILLANADAGEPERVLLADFGIARLRDDAHGLTRTGSFTATLAYAAPEQLAGGPVDHHCDQYSLACTLFALLAGRPPFAATNPVAVIDAHMRQTPPRLSSSRPDLPPGLDAVLHRALAKRPQDRYSSCSEFAAAVTDTLQSANEPTLVAGYPASAPTVRTMPPPTARPWMSLPGPEPAVWQQPARLHHAQSVPGRHRKTGAVVALVLVLVLGVAAATTAAVLVWNGRQSDGAPGWDADHQKFADAFPGVVSPKGPENNGWKNMSCSAASANSGSPSVGCAGALDFADVQLVLSDYQSSQAVQAKLDSLTTPYHEKVTGRTIRQAHPGCPTDALIFVPSSRTSDAGYGNEVFVSFPDDPIRYRFLFAIESYKRTPDETITQWWTPAPICE